MANEKKTYTAARPVMIGGKTFFTGSKVELDEATAAHLVAAGQVYLADPKPSAEDLDAAAAEKKAAEATAPKTSQPAPPSAPAPKPEEPAKG